MCECCEGMKDGSPDSAWPTTRRGFLLVSVGLLTGCAAQPAVTSLPSPVWREGEATVPSAPPRLPERTEPAPTTGRPGHMLARAAWTRRGPTYARMQRMVPIRYITVHHDAHVSDLTAQRDVAVRLEAIRRYHHGTRGWGDIGYHYVVDRAGRVWEGRPITWQGAHVKDHNEGNIGVVALGNFDKQTPSAAQLRALDEQVSWLMRRYRVPTSRVLTHQEWAATACPGRMLQAHMVEVRRSGRLG